MAKVVDENPDRLSEPLLQDQEDQSDFMTLVLSVFSSFIHLTNFYILTLAGKHYSVYVGMDESFSGILSAVNWASAVGFTFVYSYWSNYQYKIPTFACAFFVIIGDLVYFFAYSLRSASLLVLGRFLIGLGGARVINRRYIATYVPIKSRTIWNSAYVAGSIIGRGIGPILGSWLYNVDFTLLGFEINGDTSPALLMSLVWIFYAILVLIFFKEPKIKKSSQDSISSSTSESMLPTYVTLLALVMPKIVHEAFVTSIPIIAPLLFDWSIEFVGVFIAIISLASAPVHIVIAATSHRFEDRQYIRVALALTFIGSVFLINFKNIGEAQYIVGTVVMFIGMNMDDGVTASLLSKVMPAYVAEGIFNAGLVVTFAGSFARGVGGFMIGVSGWIEKNSFYMENILFFPLAIMSFTTLIVFVMNYEILDLKRKNKIIMNR